MNKLIFIVLCLSVPIVFANNAIYYLGDGGFSGNSTIYSSSYCYGQLFIGNYTHNESTLAGIYYLTINQFLLCGNGLCGLGESCLNCPADCGACQVCGDLTCNGTETCATCVLDCGACLYCGDGFCKGTENCATCPKDCHACPGGGGGDSGLDSYYENITKVNVSEIIYNVYCSKNISFPLRIISRCEYINGECDDGENFLLDAECPVDWPLVRSGDILKQMWFVRLFLILSIFLLFRDSKKYPLVVAVSLALFIYNHAFVRPGEIIDQMRCTDINFFMNAGDCIMPSNPMFGWIVMLSIIALLVLSVHKTPSKKPQREIEEEDDTDE